MSVTIRLPELSPNMERATIVRWLKREGEHVAVGDILAEVETDKATMEMEAMDTGVLDKILVCDGARDVEVNAPIAVLRGEIGASRADASRTDETPAMSEPGRLAASPLARKLARQLDVKLDQLAGSGPGQRIIAADVRAAARPQPAGLDSDEPLGRQDQQIPPRKPDAAIHVETPVDGFRRTIARNLSASKRDIPHFRVSIDVDCDAVLALRKTINERSPDLRLSLNDFVIKAVACAMEQTPEANAIWAEDKILRYSSVDVGVAISAGERLYAPVIRDVAKRTISSLSAEVRSLTAKAKTNSLTPRDLEGGSTAVSNLGMFGIRAFDAIINPPQSSIFAVGQAEPRAVVREGALAVATLMTVTMSCDHRVIDGAVAARAMGKLKALIEEPLLLIV